MISRAPQLEGRVLDDRYELHELAGEGAFGRVYRGRDRRLDRIVAVKLIKPQWSEDAGWVERFEREAQLLARVSHPGITQIFDVGRADEGLYYVAELVDGESLASRLRRGPLPPVQAARVAEQLCRALEHAHARRVLHLDIKPGNVLISSTGHVKLGDFGVARLAGGSLDGTGLVHGTPRYMSPEQARGLPLTAASDLYSVGVVLSEMLTGAPPARLARIVDRALAKNPADRYPSAGKMADALARATDRGRAADPARARPAPRTPPVAAPPGSALSGSPPPGDRTRLAPRMSPRRNVNPAARRQSIALFGLATAILVGLIVGALVLASPRHVRVPALRGLGQARIGARAHELGLRVVYARRFDPAPAGLAIGQSPVPGTRVEAGTTVRVVLSQGPPPVEVPRLSGQPSGSARAILASLGLTARVTAVPAPGVSPGTVVAQRPAPGAYVGRATTVALSVAEVPSWRELATYSGHGELRSAAVRVRGSQFRIRYRMSYVGTCTWILFCDGPTAKLINTGTGSTVAHFGLNDGGLQTRVVASGPGGYSLQISPGSDTARWSVDVQDYY